MKYTIEKTEKYCLLQLHEEKLDSLIAPDLKSELVKLNAEGIKNIIVDMAEIKYVDSSGLSSILVGNRLCENDEGMFVIARATDHVLKLVNISHLNTILHLLPTVEESIDAVFMNEVEKNLRSGDKDE
ncbi:MAG TPA: STAS domain-containing protein [Cytophagaceae bacterium]|jgi:anti-sigma B factor antagonist|nr:STAS domain-containing protein [Cytophagaceae bacterium]